LLVLQKAKTLNKIRRVLRPDIMFFMIHEASDEKL
jgi:hypothetical protein